MDTVKTLEIAIFSSPDTWPSSASPEMINAGGPAGMIIILNQRNGSERRTGVYLARG